VIVGDRSSDCAIFAVPAVRQGFSDGLAYFYGNVLECASFCAEPYSRQITPNILSPPSSVPDRCLPHQHDNKASLVLG
jgi:hypothetical protein